MCPNRALMPLLLCVRHVLVTMPLLCCADCLLRPCHDQDAEPCSPPLQYCWSLLHSDACHGHPSSSRHSIMHAASTQSVQQHSRPTAACQCMVLVIVAGTTIVPCCTIVLVLKYQYLPFFCFFLFCLGFWLFLVLVRRTITSADTSNIVPAHQQCAHIKN